MGFRIDSIIMQQIEEIRQQTPNITYTFKGKELSITRIIQEIENRITVGREFY